MLCTVYGDGVTLAPNLLGIASDRAAGRGDNHFTRDPAGGLVGRRVHTTPPRRDHPPA